jgi:hypothetical protein
MTDAIAQSLLMMESGGALIILQLKFRVDFHG